MISVTESSASSGSSTPSPTASSTTRRISRARSAVERTGPLARDHPADDALQARAPLLLGEDGDLVEVDLLEQPPAVVADAVRGAVVPSGARGDDAIPEAHYEGSMALRVARNFSWPSPGTMIGIRTLTFAVSPRTSTFSPFRRPCETA